MSTIARLCSFVLLIFGLFGLALALDVTPLAVADPTPCPHKANPEVDCAAQDVCSDATTFATCQAWEEVAIRAKVGQGLFQKKA
jgi:hypothetical protein